MRINNFIQINDWKIKDFFKFILIIQFILLVTIILETMGLQTLNLRIFIAFIYLTFLPGIIILRILKLHKLGNSNTLLYTIGLSTLFLMVIGFLMNLVYPIFGIPRPISTMNLIITITIILFALCVLSYVRDKEFYDQSDQSEIDVDKLFSNPALFLYLILILVINGTYLVNLYNNNVLLMIVILIISSIPILITFTKFIPPALYSLTIFIIALSLLYHRILISPYLVGWDIQIEYYFYNLVEMNGIWNSSLAHNYNSVLSVTILPAIYSKLMNVNGVFVFKIIYPFLFAFVPLGLFNIFKKQIDEKMAFLSITYFIFLFTFFTEMTALGKQQISEIFYMLLILTMLDDKLDFFIKRFFYIFFGTGMILSHYGMTYYYISILLLTSFFMRFILKYKSDVLKPLTILRLIISSIFLYMYTSSSTAFNSIINLGESIIKNLNNFLKPDSTHAFHILTDIIDGPLHILARIFYYIPMFFISTGIFYLLVSIIKKNKIKYNNDFAAFAITNFFILLMVVFIPRFDALNIERSFHIGLFFLAPFFITEFIEFLGKVSVIFSWERTIKKNELRILSIFLSIFLLFNSGFMYEIANEHPSSFSLSQESMKEDGYIKTLMNFYNMFFTDYDVFGVRWISKHKDYQTQIYSDFPRKGLIFKSYGMMWDEGLLLKNITSINDDLYIYLGYFNLKYNIMNDYLLEETSWNLTNILPLLIHKNEIYSNGGCIIYK